ncbi:hypothetical protein BDY21DRAFT_352554 [Lineolata rhizophorae]|uniref:Uncharacterized protein n=1 Tax=Lineolata rhizophorae TaxID=578093 RepID=A0A6A6NSM7_9PEZI|nr:hypothetical protein BDY21DRAFT_352554 [Lineolata rhizophorae]
MTRLKRSSSLTKPDLSPCKIHGDYIICHSRELEMSKKRGRPIITASEGSRFGQAVYNDDTQPFQYRAPDVIFHVPWSYEVGI